MLRADVGDVVAAVIGAMSTYAGNAAIVQYGCGLLASLAFKAPKVKSRIVNQGGIDAVLNCMRVLRHHPMAQVATCSVLRNLTAQSGSSPLGEGRKEKKRQEEKKINEIKHVLRETRMDAQKGTSH